MIKNISYKSKVFSEFLKNCESRHGDFSSNNSPQVVWGWFCPSLTAAFCLFKRKWESSILTESRWGLRWTAARSKRDLEKAIPHLPEVFYKLNASSVAVRVPMSDHFFVQILERIGFCYSGGLVILVQNHAALSLVTKIPEVSLRSVQKKDIAQLEKIAFTAFQEGRFYHELGLKRGAAQKIYSAWGKNAVNYADEVWVAGLNKILGFVSLKKDAPNKRLWIDLIAVTPKAQGQGLGMWLVQKSAQRASRTAGWSLGVKTEPENLKALRFYLKNGFLLESFQLDYFWRPAETK